MRLWRTISWLISMPIIPTRLRMFLLRSFGVKASPTAVIAPGVFLGSNNLTIGEHGFVNYGCFLDGAAPIYLGKYVRVGPRVSLLTGSHKYSNTRIRRGPDSMPLNEPIIIQDGAWIGLGSIIMPGVTISTGCIIAAGAVVLKSTEPNGLYAGNPAKRIKDLPDE